MNTREYEQHQLKLIGQSYLERGFKVSYEVNIKGLSYEFDALAQNDLGEIVIIELVNKRLSDEAMQKRLDALKDVSTLLPEAKVDFRYIDGDAGVLMMARSHPQEANRRDLWRALTARLPRLAAERVDATRPFLELWLLHVTAIRAYSAKLGWNHAEIESVLDLYNEMLQSKILVAPETVADDVSQDLFELYTEARGALQGASIGHGTFLQLRAHVLEVRRQIRRQVTQVAVTSRKRR